MKKIFINIGLILGLFVALSLNSCKDDITPVVDELNFTRAFSPVALTTEISNVTTLTLTWSAAKNVDHYVVEIREGSDAENGALVKSIEVPGTAFSLAYVLPAGDTQFSARIKAVSSKSGVEDSRWTSTTFKTLPENLFTDYVSSMSAFQTATIKWKPGIVATTIELDNGTTKTPYAISAAELTAGVKVITSLQKGNYKVNLLNTTFSRGKTSVVIEGDVLVNAGEDLATAIAALPSGGVMILADGASFPIAANFLINKNIKIRAITTANRPTIYPATGASTTVGMFLIDAAATDSIVFQNVVITGLISNITGGSTVTGVYDQANGATNACNIGKLKFKGCVIEHFNRHIIRLRGTVVQIVANFEVDDCIIDDFGSNNTGYGLVNANNAAASIVNIKFTNSTVYNTKCGLISYGAGLGCASVLVDNCTLNATVLDNTRYLIDFGTSTTSSAGTITISDCVFGQTAANGIRNNLMTISGITGSYYTNDFVPVLGTFISSMTAYSGASTALWTNPASGIFSFLDTSFAGKSTAGDPRWMP